MVELAEEHAADFATRAAEHDRENTFVAENFDRMKESGLLAAAAPKEFGGLGVGSAHDITVAISRLARGCGSTAIAANMHIGAVWVVTRNWRQGIAHAGQDSIRHAIDDALWQHIARRCNVATGRDAWRNSRGLSQ